METAKNSRLRHFPVSWFATVMGMTGFAIAWRRAELLLPVPEVLPLALVAFSGALFLLLAGAYLTKFLRFREDVIKEWHHPVRVNFVPTISIGLILLATALVSNAPTLSFWIWSFGSLLNLVLTLYVMSFWINHTGFQIQHMNPAWFIPVVGNILVPIAGVHHANAEISWFFFSIGLVFWLVLFTIVIYRVIFHDPIPERLVPTFFILIAPPAVGFLSYSALVGGVDSFARVLYYGALFLTLLLSTQYGRFARLKFYLSWWAYSFPAAAITIASLRMYKHTGLVWHQAISWVLLLALTAIIVLLLVRTVRAVQRQEICVEE